MTGRKRYSHPLRRMIAQVTQSHLVIIVKKRYLDMVKLLSLLIILFLRFCLLNHWTTTYCLSHNFVRWTTIVCSLTKV
jgi:hypothetical protein